MLMYENVFSFLVQMSINLSLWTVVSYITQFNLFQKPHWNFSQSHWNFSHVHESENYTARVNKDN